MYSLVLTLGHNSSAILVKKGEVLCGYENERLSKIKADSAFPYLAITEIGKYYDLKSVSKIYVSHWETFGDIDKMSQKHWSRHWINQHFPNVPILSHTEDFTHHDAHFLAAKAWADRDFRWTIVADGFGNYNEVISVYERDKLIHRSFGFDKSIGLLYQYTTAFLGMKMNQDEYKLLGYEAHIQEVASVKEIQRIKEEANILAKSYFRRIRSGKLQPDYDLIAGIDALPRFRERITRTMRDFCMRFKITQANDFTKRVYISFYVQSAVEEIMMMLIHHLGITEAILTGGIFMNVKLNSKIAYYLTHTCIYPICGDQGTGLGVYDYYEEDLQPAKDLFWGKRPDSAILNIKNLWQVEDETELIDGIIDNLYSNKIVNVIFGNMEFGARALGHTSTLALPTKENVEYINMLNGRDTIMPMAGMVTPSILTRYYNRQNVHRSYKYMICTVNYQADEMDPEWAGCHHNHPTNKIYTNRIQLVNDDIFGRIVEEMGMIINTSFNMHGVPIVYDAEDIVKTHFYQLERDVENRMITLIKL